MFFGGSVFEGLRLGVVTTVNIDIRTMVLKYITSCSLKDKHQCF